MRYWLLLATMMLKVKYSKGQEGNKLPDPEHYSRRRLTQQYKTKKSLVRNIWITACLLMLFNPVLPVVLIIALPTTLLSFMILDETP